MKRVYANEKWCLGCHLCEYYCAFADLGAKGEQDMARALKDVTINPKISIEEKEGICFAVSCRHCAEPLCMKGCITGALRAEQGVITIDKDKCVECYTCILCCPYGAIAPSANGAIQKCELCVHSADPQPACVKGCPNGALVFEERA